jgi:UDP-GlcNAc:undecaprenyl-phosphate GlcNAc-1-phosphate transferase
MNLYLYFIVYIFISFALLIFYQKLSNTYKLFDNNDNEFSSKLKIPTGAGIVFFIVILISMIIFFKTEYVFLNLPERLWPLITSISFLCIISFYDDFKPINPIIKLFLQIIFVYLSLASIDVWSLGLPLKISIFIIIVYWVYIINIINFIDGADGFLTVFSISFFLILLFASIHYEFFFLKAITLTILPVLIVFLFFNKPNAKLYMGDTGSILLGFMMGYVCIHLILNGHWSLTITLLAYPICDCTITLVKKVAKGNLPWARMYDYFFLMPIKKDYLLKKKVFKIIIITSLINITIGYAQIFFDLSYLFILSLIANLSTIWIYYKSGNKKLTIS